VSAAESNPLLCPLGALEMASPLTSLRGARGLPQGGGRPGKHAGAPGRAQRRGAGERLGRGCRAWALARGGEPSRSGCGWRTAARPVRLTPNHHRLTHTSGESAGRGIPLSSRSGFDRGAGFSSRGILTVSARPVEVACGRPAHRRWEMHASPPVDRRQVRFGQPVTGAPGNFPRTKNARPRAV